MGVAVPRGTGGHPESGTPSKVRSQALVCWSTDFSSFRVTPPPPLIYNIRTISINKLYCTSILSSSEGGEGKGKGLGAGWTNGVMGGV